MARLRPPMLCALSLLASAGCGEAPAPLDPAPLDLARGYAPVEDPPPTWGDTPGGPALTPAPDADGPLVRATVELGREDWRPGPVPGTFAATLPAPAVRPGEVRLTVDSEPAPRAEPGRGALEALEAGSWFLGGAQLLLATGEPPGSATVELPLPLGREVDGRWRVRLPGLTGDGLPLATGAARAIAFEPAGVDRQLRFWSAVAGDGDEVRLRVTVDGGEPLTFAQATPPAGRLVERRVAVPAGAREVTLELEGPPCLGAALAPRLAPAADRADDPRPDLVVVLADTLRADMLAAYRPRPVEPAPMPLLDARAGAGRLFLHARTNASWTLPAQATLLSGLPPRTHGAVAGDLGLPPPAPRLARRLRDAGYRTVAVTEGSYVSRAFGLDLGFELFDERSRDVRTTVERALAHLESDDPRPLFLYVQTYRAHSPYRAGPAEAPAGLAAAFPTDVRLELERRPDLLALLRDRLGDEREVEAAIAAHRAGIEEQWATYLAGAYDLDAALDPLFEALLERPRSAPATRVVFTSDHGEQFGEHGVVGHGSGVWDTLLRVPLVVLGTGVESGVDPRPATLLDLAPTLTAWAGLAPVASDAGAALAVDAPLASAVTALERPSFAWACATPPHADARAVIVGDAKWIEFDPSPAAPGTHAVYDLDRDPLERAPTLFEAVPPSFAPLAPRRAELSAPPEVPPAPPDLDAEVRRRLRELGYGD